MKSKIATPDLQSLQDRIMIWANRTFGNQGQDKRVKKLLNETEELARHPFDKAEICDCLIVLLQVAKGAGMNSYQLIQGSMEKQRINELREWTTAPDGTAQHV